MTELEYIVKQAKKSYYTEWDDKELRKWQYITNQAGTET